MPKIGPGSLTEGLGLTGPYLAECLSRTRGRGLVAQIERRVALTGKLTRRDQAAALRAFEADLPGLGRPGAEARVEEVDRAVLRWALSLGLEARLRVREQQRRALPEEFAEGDFRFEVDPASEDTAEERVFLPEEHPD